MHRKLNRHNVHTLVWYFLCCETRLKNDATHIIIINCSSDKNATPSPIESSNEKGKESDDSVYLRYRHDPQ